MKFSLYHNGILNTLPNREITLEDCIGILIQDNQNIEQIRKETDSKKKDALKKKLSYVTFGGTFSSRSKANLVKASGYASFDLDHLPNLKDTKARLMMDDYVCLVFVSPSGDGLKFVVKIPEVKDDEEYKKYWLSIAEHFNLPEQDDSCKDICRACFLSVDKEPYYNPDSKVYTKKVEHSVVNPTRTQQLTEEDEKIIDSIKDKWVEGNRQELAMSLAGYLRKEKKYGFDRAASIVRSVCEEMGDKDVNERLNAVQSTFLKDEGEVKGISGLKEKEINVFSVRENVLQLIATRQEDEATELVVKTILESNYINTIKQDKASEMWFYHEGIRKPNGESHVRELCRSMFGQAYTPQRTNKVVAKIQADTFIEADDFFKREMENLQEIPVLNGILNLETRELTPYTPEKYFFNKINAEYNPDASCPSTRKFMSEVLRKPEDIEVSFEISGSCLLKKMLVQSATMLVGDGENGKGVYCNHLKKFLGEPNCSSIPLNQLTADSFSVCGLFGKLANLAGDISNTDLKETGRFKEITSGTDMVTAKRKFLNDLFFENYAKLIFSCNELPRVYDFSHGFWRRWVILEFPYKFLKSNEFEVVEDKTNVKIADPQIIEKISTEEEMSGFLNECLDGLDRLKKNRQYSFTKSTAEVKDYWIRKSDSFTAFCMDSIEEDIEGSISKKHLRRAFMKYCKNHKVKGAGDKNIKAVLENLYGVVESRRVIHSGSFDRETIWEGIRFKQEMSKVKEVKGILPLGQNGDFPIGAKTLDTLTNSKTTIEPEIKIEVERV